MPTKEYWHPRIFRPSGGPVYLLSTRIVMSTYLESIHQYEFSRKIVYCIQNTVGSCASIIYVTPIDHFQFEMRINLFTKFSYDYLEIILTQIDLNYANIKIILFIYLSQF